MSLVTETSPETFLQGRKQKLQIDTETGDNTSEHNVLYSTFQYTYTSLLEFEKCDFILMHPAILGRF
jgi:hypothetical protein